jgi:hypothetical protein
MKYAHLDFVGDIARVTLCHPTGNRINFAKRPRFSRLSSASTTVLQRSFWSGRREPISA